MKQRVIKLTLLLLVGALLVGACGPTPTPIAPQPTPGAGETPGPGDPAGARDAVLAYLAAHYSGQAPAAGLTWTEKHPTPALLGTETYQYTAGDWAIGVTFPVVAPENEVYTVVVDNTATGFHWEGTVNASGQVTQTSITPGQGSPTSTSPAPGTPTPTTTPAGQGTSTPSVSIGQDDLAKLVQGNGTFALNLYQALSKQSGNLFFSPYSMSEALAMAYAGARGQTETQMAQTLQFLLAQDRLHPAFHALDQELAKRAEPAQGAKEPAFQLNIANALWGQKGYTFLPAFLDVLKANYGAGMRFVDFVNATEQARATINDWVSQQTQGKIKDLIPPGVLDSLTRLVLTNAIYFKAAWATPFNPKATQDGSFTRLDGSQVTVPMMQQTGSMGYAEAKGVQVVELPYQGYQVAMDIILPQAGQFAAVESSLDATQVASLLKSVAPQQVQLTMPKFTFSSEFSLKDVLSAMGMPLAFTSDADFSGMTGTRELSISAVLHKAFVAVDENGTEAAAATAVVVGLTSMPSQPVVVTVDRPFLFLIRDLKTGTILFLGRVEDPTS